jgi:hypothetical protein
VVIATSTTGVGHVEALSRSARSAGDRRRRRLQKMVVRYRLTGSHCQLMFLASLHRADGTRLTLSTGSIYSYAARIGSRTGNPVPRPVRKAGIQITRKEETLASKKVGTRAAQNGETPRIPSQPHQSQDQRKFGAPCMHSSQWLRFIPRCALTISTKYNQHFFDAVLCDLIYRHFHICRRSHRICRPYKR